MIEHVLVVATSELQPFLTSTFTNDRSQEILSKIREQHKFMPRDEAENDPKWKQIIPYVLVRHQDNYLMLRRFKTQGEARLHDKLSLGVGGHINQDTPMHGFTDIISASLHRELDEEITLKSSYEVHAIGVLNDDSSAVGKVHLGLAFLLAVKSSGFEVNEKDQMSATWATVDEIQAAYDQLEGWSQILFERCIKYPAHTESANVAAPLDAQCPPPPG
jgi:predicted NUDIX family phosphoesterase